MINVKPTKPKNFIGIIIRNGDNGFISFRAAGREGKWYRGWHSPSSLTEVLNYVDQIVNNRKTNQPTNVTH